MLIAHRIALDRNERQSTYMARAAGTARFAYNWALAEWQRQYAEFEAGNCPSRPSQAALRRPLNAIKRDQFPWMLEVTKNAPQMAIMQLGRAFENFFAGRSRYPRFRRKGVRERFTLTNDQVRVDGWRLRVACLGWVRLRERLRFNGRILSATISRTADRWFVSLAVDRPDAAHLPPAENQGAVGVDLGVTALATLSTGGPPIEGPRAHKALLARQRRLSRSLSRKRKGSANRRKARLKLARLHRRIGNIRQDALHKLTTDLTRRFDTIGIEDLDVTDMLRDRRMARSVADMGFHEFRRQLEYKAAMRGVAVVVADRWFASSKTCSACGHRLESLALSERSWDCPACGARHDRDLNAAINLKRYAVSSTVSACGGNGSGPGVTARVKPAPVKQEASAVPTDA